MDSEKATAVSPSSPLRARAEYAKLVDCLSEKMFARSKCKAKMEVGRMDSEKATAVSPSSPLHARGKRNGVTRTEDDQVPQERETAETDQFSLLAPPRIGVRACVRTQS